jgi:hypothetical protein
MDSQKKLLPPCFKIKGDCWFQTWGLSDAIANVAINLKITVLFCSEPDTKPHPIDRGCDIVLPDNV